MELTFARQAGTDVLVTCDSRPSHTFDLQMLVPGENGPPQPIDDPVAYGKAVYQALFPPETSARHGLDAMPGRILLVTTDDAIDTIPWEYAYGLYGAEDVENFLVLACHIVRGLPFDQRVPPPTLEDNLHIVAIPSHPLDKDLAPLDIVAEWIRLKEIVHEVPYTISLERVRPPTIEQLRRLLANQRNRVVHFMGHGGQHETGAILCFERENGKLHPLTAREFVLRVRGSVFLVTLNACVSATPGPTVFSNLAAALVRQKTPYALGMRLSIHDDDARAFSRTFYGELASGVSVEEALFQARLTLANSQRSWVIGVPVLYTALTTPATGFISIEGTPSVNEHQPQIEVSGLPRAEGAFQGRIDELKQLGDLLTGDHRPRLVTIHGSGGQGKTALAREAVERFAYAWPGGVWATTLENLPSREVFVNELARFLGIATEEINDPGEIERQVIRHMNQRRTLIVLDNTETLIEAVRVATEAVTRLTEFIQQLASPTVSLLVTSREHLGWSGEIALEIGGLSPEEGANLFRQSAPQRTEAIDMEVAQQLSQKVDGHPFSLRLLGGAFNASAIPLSTFLTEYEERLVKAEDRYVGEHHRHRTFYASIETSMRYLDREHCQLLSGLWIFHAPFIPQTAAAIFDSQAGDNQVEGSKDVHAPFFDRLHALWRRGLLNYETVQVGGDTMPFYRFPPIMRIYVEQFLAHSSERETLLTRFGEEYAKLVSNLNHTLDRSVFAAPIALVLRDDIERGVSYVKGVEQGYYLLSWGRILQRLGDFRGGLNLAEKALEIGEEQDQKLKLQALNYIALMYQGTGKLQEAIMLLEQALPELQESGERAGEGATLSNMAALYQQIGKPQVALQLYERALVIRREVGDRAGEAATLGNMGGLYADTGGKKEALKLYEQAAPLMEKEEDRAGEASRLYGMANLYQSMEQYSEARVAFEQSITLNQMVFHRAGEVAGLVGLGLLLYQHLDRAQEAIEKMEQALNVMEAFDISHDAAGRTRETLQQFLNTMRQGIQFDQAANKSAKISSSELRQMITGTIAVMTIIQHYKAKWRTDMAKALQEVQQKSDAQNEVDFFSALLDIVDGQSPVLPDVHPYASAIAEILKGIPRRKMQNKPTPDIKFGKKRMKQRKVRKGKNSRGRVGRI